jgi:hypothetical protein
MSTQTGCSPLSLAKGGFTELRGAQGTVHAIAEPPAGFAAGLSGIEIGKVTNTIAPVCSEQMRQLVEIALRNRAAGASQEMTGTGVCTVDVDLTFNKEPGGVMALVGKGAMLIGRVVVRDAQGRQAADLIVVTASEAMRTTAREVAEEFADTVVKRVREGPE